MYVTLCRLAETRQSPDTYYPALATGPTTPHETMPLSSLFSRVEVRGRGLCIRGARRARVQSLHSRFSSSYLREPACSGGVERVGSGENQSGAPWMAG